MLLLLVAFAAAGCQTARQKVETDVVRTVKLRGNCDATELKGLMRGLRRTAFSCETPATLVAAQMEQAASPTLVRYPLFNRLVKPQALKYGALDRDAYRLEVWFAHNGYFDARFEGWEVHRRKPPMLYRRDRRSIRDVFKKRSNRVVTHRRGDVKRAGVVDVVGHIDRGPQSIVRSIDIVGYPKEAELIVNLVRRELFLKEGDLFSLEVIELARATLEAKLQERGYAYATALVATEAHPDEGAVDVRLVLDMARNKTSRFGEVTFSGIERTPADKLANMVVFHEGDPYRVLQLERTRQQLFQTSAFSVVDVVPDLSVRGADPVPVDIKLKETSFRSWRVGFGGEWDGFTLTLPLSLRYRNVNLFDELVRFQLSGEVGYSSRAGSGLDVGKQDNALGTVLDVADTLVYETEASVVWPQLFGKRVDGRMVAKVDRDLLNGQFLFQNPEIDLGFIFRASRHTTLTFGPHAELYTMPDLLEGRGTPEQVLSGQAIFGRDFDGRFSLTALDARLTVDYRNDPLSPSHGSYWDLGVRQAVPLTNDDFLYTDISAEVRGFRRAKDLWSKWSSDIVFAGRLKGRFLQSWGDSTLPYPERVFMGGQGDIRAFRDGQVGPYDLLCLYQPTDQGDPFSNAQGRGQEGQQRYLSRGGVAGVVGSSELRFPLLRGYDLSGQVFGDGGLFTTEVGTRLRTVFRWGAGLGLTYDSLVGPIRVDFAMRPVVAEDIEPVDHVNCRNDYDLARPYGLFTNGTSKRQFQYENPQNPVTQIHISIGQPF